MNRKAIIFDIDGTLADVEHRRHHLPNWGAFFEHMGADKPVDPVVWLSARVVEAGLFQALDGDDPGFDIFICTGRPADYRGVTEKWLARHAPLLWAHTKRLLMRPAGDQRADTTVKKEMLNVLRGEGYDVMLAIDDRQSVVDMWRQNGVTCLQAAPGDFDSKVGHADPGNLVILIGPSGAGKSTLAQHAVANDPRFDQSAVVSTDAIRAVLTGDFKDQSMNTETFHAYHSLVRERVRCGLHTIADATNIRRQARLKLLTCVPAEAKVEYWIVDRPTAEKQRTADWRLGVIVKGRTLMDYHSDVFRSNLNGILAGDGDPRVEVCDWRGRLPDPK